MAEIARTMKAAIKLGHRRTRLTRAQAEALRGGIEFSPRGRREGQVCYVGLCDPETGNLLVGYYDKNGNCNDFVKVPCDD